MERQTLINRCRTARAPPPERGYLIAYGYRSRLILKLNVLSGAVRSGVVSLRVRCTTFNPMVKLHGLSELGRSLIMPGSRVRVPPFPPAPSIACARRALAAPHRGRAVRRA
jgi:hypothetical protein